ncbi:MAG: formylglycine-generating enzyme family protein [Ardenticatenaceae bacterium]
MVQVYVPAGDFEMGAVDDDPDADDDEKPRHTVYLDAFWIDQTEVTNAQYAQCVADGACERPGSNESWTRDSYYGNAQFDNYPVIWVSWHNALAYCQWAERRLPTEAQWEKAAGGTDGRKWPWGNQRPDNTLVNFNRNVGDTTPVGNYPAGASPYGAYDMAGNVWEWVFDEYGSNYYASSPSDNPVGPSSAKTKILRGGPWYHSAPYIRVRDRVQNFAINRDQLRGFRCASSP